MSVIVIETTKPESLSIVAPAQSVRRIKRCETHGSVYVAAVALLRRCSAEELKALEQHDLRKLKRWASAVEAPADGEANALPSQL